MKYLSTRSDDGTPIRLARWNEQGQRDLLIAHGFSEHIGRYHHIGKFFADHGWRVTALEFRGHGKSGGKKGHVDQWIHFNEDLQAAMGTVGRPMALVGHSLGGLISLWSMMYPLTPEVRCVALSNPLLGLVDTPSRRRVLFAKIAARIVPKMIISRESNPERLSRDQQVVEAYRNDPLVSSAVTVRLGQQTVTALQTVNDYAPKYNYPLRLMLGGADSVCCPVQAQEFASKYGGKIDTVIYEQCFHELFNEPEKEEILNETVQWLVEHF